MWCLGVPARGPSSAAVLSERIGSEGRGGGRWLLHLDPIRDDPVRDSGRGGCVPLPCPHKEVLYAAWQSPRGCGFLRKEGVLFGLQGSLSSATSQCLWLSASMAIESLWAAGGELAGTGMLGAFWCLRGELPKPWISHVGGRVELGKVV